MNKVRFLGLAIFVSFFLAACSFSKKDEKLEASTEGPNALGIRQFYASNFSQAFTALSGKAAQGDPEALLFTMMIRRNGLDGKAPDLALTPYWNILKIKVLNIEEELKAKQLVGQRLESFQTILAQFYYFRNESPNDRQEALKLAKLAAKKGFSPALNFLIYMHQQNGSYAAAAVLAQTGAKKNDPLATLSLSYFHREGLGLRADNLRAAALAHKSATLAPTFGRAQSEVGTYYERGLGVTQSPQEALRWHKKSADLGYALGLINFKKAKTSPAQIEKSVLY